MLDILIKNAEILTMDDSRPAVSGGAVGIQGEKIERVYEKGEALPIARRVIDAKGNILMPGLVNTHSHTAMCVMRGYADDLSLGEWLFDKIFPAEDRLTKEAVLSGVRLGVAEMLASGTTSFSDMYSNEPAAAEIIAASGIRANLSNGVIALGNDFVYENDRSYRELYALIRDWHCKEHGRIRTDAAIHAEYTSPPWVWERTHEIAAAHGLVTQVHLSESKKEVLASKERHGVSPVGILAKHGVFDTPTVAAHCVWLDEDDILIMAEKKVTAAHCPVSNLKLASGIADVRRLKINGVNVSLGTDGCASNNTLDLFEEIKLAALLAKGSTLDPTAVPAYEALKMATVNGAKAQGRENEIGRIREGLEADIIMLNVHTPHMQPVYSPASAAAYAANGGDVLLTMVQGRILYENGEWTTIDVEKAIRDVNKIAVPIVKSVK